MTDNPYLQTIFPEDEDAEPPTQEDFEDWAGEKLDEMREDDDEWRKLYG